MSEIFSAFAIAFELIVSLDRELYTIIGRTMYVSISAVAMAALSGVFLGAVLAVYRFPGRRAVSVVLNALMGLPPVVVGLPVVAMGTSSPELMVSEFSALSGFPFIAIGNVVGSNIANVLLVIGVPVLIHSISCTEETLPRQTGLMIGVTLMFMVMCYLTPLGTIDGIILLLVLAGFLTMTVRGAAVMPLDDAEDELERVLGLPGE